jgi:hypothetical protein
MTSTATAVATDVATAHHTTPTITMTSRSPHMYVMQEALAREHMRQREREARQARLSAELVSALVWQYLAERAKAAATRHSHRATQALVQP